MKIVADSKIPFLKGVFEPFCDVEYVPGNKINNSHLINAEILIIRTRTFCNKELLEGTNIKFIATATIGFDHIDTEYCSKNNIEWINAPGCNSGAVQQWFIAALLYYAKERSIDLTTKTLGVIGIGNVGSKIVEFADVLGMSVILNDPPREQNEGSCIFRSLATIQQECNIISFHVPLILEGEFKTYHLVDEKFLNRISPNTLLINSSRGEVFDTKAMLNWAKVNEKESGLMLDVWENEPNISLDLLQNTDLATPHIAGYSEEGKANGTAAVVQAVSVYLGLPLDDWTPEMKRETNELKMLIDCEQKTLQDIITEAILATYQIFNDDQMLRNNTSKFESLRSEYNLRHEPSSWKVELKNETELIRSSLTQLGFTVC